MSDSDLNLSIPVTTPTQSATVEFLYPDLNLSTPAHSLGKTETEYVKTLNAETRKAREKILESWKKAVAVEKGYITDTTSASQTRDQIKTLRKRISKETRSALHRYTSNTIKISNPKRKIRPKNYLC